MAPFCITSLACMFSVLVSSGMACMPMFPLPVDSHPVVCNWSLLPSSLLGQTETLCEDPGRKGLPSFHLFFTYLEVSLIWKYLWSEMNMIYSKKEGAFYSHRALCPVFTKDHTRSVVVGGKDRGRWRNLLEWGEWFGNRSLLIEKLWCMGNHWRQAGFWQQSLNW